MTTALTLRSIEVHAEGEPGRILTDAGHLVQGRTMAERLAYCRAELDGLRRLMLHEPRGYPGLCAVILTTPVNPGSDFGIVVLEQGGFTPMSGSNTICAVTAAVESGIVACVEPVTEVTIDTAIGVVRATAHVQAGNVESVTVANVPAYVVELDRPVEVHGFGSVPVDIVFGGQFFAQAKASDFSVSLDPAHGRELARIGALVKLAVNEQVSVRHPTNSDINDVNLVMLHTGDRVPGRLDRNTVILCNGRLDRADPTTWTGALDRSPCGTGTSARMAALHARGQLQVGQPFSHRSIIGSEFVGRLTGTTRLPDGTRAVLPTITGRGWVTGRSEWVLHPSDPFPQGYTVGDIWGPQPSARPEALPR